MTCGPSRAAHPAKDAPGYPRLSERICRHSDSFRTARPFVRSRAVGEVLGVATCAEGRTVSPSGRTRRAFSREMRAGSRSGVRRARRSGRSRPQQQPGLRSRSSLGRSWRCPPRLARFVAAPPEHRLRAVARRRRGPPRPRRETPGRRCRRGPVHTIRGCARGRWRACLM